MKSPKRNAILISVIVPVYNTEKYLSKCIDSILKQSFKNFELLLVDDESTDSSGSICDFYLKKDNRVVVIHQKNSGVSCARNKGLDVAKGKYIAFVDSDDFVDTDYLEILYRSLISSKSDIATVYCTKFSSEDSLQFESDETKPEPLIIDSLEKYYSSFSERGNVDVVWNKLYKKILFDDLRFPPSKRYEDVYLIHRILTKCHSFCITNRHLYFYRQHENSFINNSNKIDLLWVYNGLISFYCTEYLNVSLLTMNIYNAISLSHRLKIASRQGRMPSYRDELTMLHKTLRRVLKKRVVSKRFSVFILLFLICKPLCYALLDRKK